MNNPIFRNIGHVDNEIDFADSEGSEGMKVAASCLRSGFRSRTVERFRVGQIQKHVAARDDTSVVDNLVNSRGNRAADKYLLERDVTVGYVGTDLQTAGAVARGSKGNGSNATSCETRKRPRKKRKENAKVKVRIGVSEEWKFARNCENLVRLKIGTYREHTWDWFDRTHHTSTERTERFEEMTDTRKIPTNALGTGASERDVSSFNTASGKIIADRGPCGSLDLLQSGRQCKLKARGTVEHNP